MFLVIMILLVLIVVAFRGSLGSSALLALRISFCNRGKIVVAKTDYAKDCYTDICNFFFL